MKFDHAVYFTSKQLNDIVAEQKKLGNKAVIGGRHEQWGTANTLLYAENGYIEWLALEDEEKAEKAAAAQPLVQQLLHDRQYGEGFAAICISVDNIEELKEQLDNKGFTTTAVLPASRKTAEGQLLRWKMLFIDEPVTEQLPYPFFIEWEETEEERFARLEKQGARSVKPTKRIAECTFHVEDSLQSAGEWAVMLSQKVDDAGDITIGDVVLRFKEGQYRAERLAAVRFADND